MMIHGSECSAVNSAIKIENIEDVYKWSMFYTVIAEARNSDLGQWIFNNKVLIYCLCISSQTL